MKVTYYSTRLTDLRVYVPLDIIFSHSPDNHYNSDDVHWRGGGTLSVSCYIWIVSKAEPNGGHKGLNNPKIVMHCASKGQDKKGYNRVNI